MLKYLFDHLPGEGVERPLKHQFSALNAQPDLPQSFPLFPQLSSFHDVVGGLYTPLYISSPNHLHCGPSWHSVLELVWEGDYILECEAAE